MSSLRPRLLVKVSDRATVVEVEDRLYVRLDAEGRWSTYAEGGGVFRRAVDGHVLRALGRGFESLDPAQSEVVHGLVGRRAGELLEMLERAEDLHVQGELEVARRRLGSASCWSRAQLEGEVRRFREAYPESIPILPPHRYRDLVLLPATGCPNHECSFCRLYRDRPFHVLSDTAFDRHLEAVRRLFGRALDERDGIFLGSASALSVPDERLGPRLDRIGRVLGTPRRGIASFLDPDRCPKRDGRAWASLRASGLVEVTLGLETGDPILRRRWGKGGDLGRFRRTVAALREAGIDAVLTVLVGLGEEEAGHQEATRRFLATLALGPGDRVYLSPLDGRTDADVAGWRARLAEVTPARLGTYRIDRFAWLT